MNTRAHGSSGRPTAVLLVEDNPGDAFLIRRMLPEFDVLHVSTLGEALQYLEKDTFDLVLLDLGLPDAGGLETLTRLRAKFSAVPVIITTGLSDTDLAVRALNSGAQDFFAKEK